MNTQNPIAQEITAQIQLGLFGTVGKLASQLRAIDRIAPRLKEGGLVRELQVNRDLPRRGVGITVAQRNIHAFGGLLYAVAGFAHELTTMGSDIAHSMQDSRIDVGDLSLLEADRRIQWKAYLQAYELLEELFSQETLPDLIITDIPLVVGKAAYAQVIQQDQETDEQLKSELRELREQVEFFWQRHLGRCFPFDAKGPKVVTLHRGRFGSLLRLLEKKGDQISPDPIDPEVETLIQEKWVKVLSIGIDRVVKGILIPEHRTASFEYDRDRLDKNAFPQTLIDQGGIAFHYLTGLRGNPIQVETLGSKNMWHDQGGAAEIDQLASDLIALTYFDHAKSLPLPLWYAQQAVEVVKKKGLLEFFKQEALRTMREEQVDQAWLRGWEEE